MKRLYITIILLLIAGWLVSCTSLYVVTVGPENQPKTEQAVPKTVAPETSLPLTP